MGWENGIMGRGQPPPLPHQETPLPGVLPSPFPQNHLQLSFHTCQCDTSGAFLFHAEPSRTPFTSESQLSRPGCRSGSPRGTCPCQQHRLPQCPGHPSQGSPGSKAAVLGVCTRQRWGCPGSIQPPQPLWEQSWLGTDPAEPPAPTQPTAGRDRNFLPEPFHGSERETRSRHFCSFQGRPPVKCWDTELLPPPPGARGAPGSHQPLPTHSSPRACSQLRECHRSRGREAAGGSEMGPAPSAAPPSSALTRGWRGIK